MLSNFNHLKSPDNYYGDEKPVFMTDAIDENGEVIMIPTTLEPDYADMDYRTFSARSVIANGNKLLPSDAIQGVSFHQLSHRDNVVNFVENNIPNKQK